MSTPFERFRNLQCPGLPDPIPLHTIIQFLCAHRGKRPSGLGFPSLTQNELGKNNPLLIKSFLTLVETLRVKSLLSGELGHRSLRPGSFSV